MPTDGFNRTLADSKDGEQALDQREQGGEAVPPAPIGRPLALVADGEVTARSLAGEVLRAEGFEIREAANGRVAVELFRQLRPDLVVLGSVLPEQDGYAVCAAIRNLAGGPPVPILMITASDDPTSIDHAYQAGATDFIGQPFDRPMLAHRLRYLWRASRSVEGPRISEERNRALVSAIPDLVLQIDDAGVIQEIHVPGDFLPNLALAATRGKHLRDTPLAPLERQLTEHLRLALQTGNATHFTYRAMIADVGRSLEIRMVPGGPREVLAVVRDLTELDLADEHLQASLREKDVLVKEIHHRVKNNLQTISSLVHLQSKHIKDQSLLSLFWDTQYRIKSMALIHEKLYQSKDLGRIDFVEYIRSLAAVLFRSYPPIDQSSPLVPVQRNHVRLLIKGRDIYMGMDTAIPCALLINELVSNSLKHAFPQGRTGKVRIDIRSPEAGSFILTVRDSGIGLPAGLDIHQCDSLGLQLVVALTRQLKGSIELDRRSGTTFTIRFRELRYKERASTFAANTYQAGLPQ